VRYMVTGAAGFIGSHLMNTLSSQGHNVIGLDDMSTGDLNNLSSSKLRYNCLTGDITNTHDMINLSNTLSSDIDVIFHLAAKSRIAPSFDNPQENFNVNVMGTINVLELARKHNASVVYAGSSSCCENVFANPYTASKHLGEEACLTYLSVYGVRVSIARFFNVYGPSQIDSGEYATVMGIFRRQKKAGQPLTVTGDGSKRRDFVHVDDVVRGLIGISKNANGEGETYNLGSGEDISILELANLFQPDKIDFLPERPGELETTLADITNAQRDFGYQPVGDLKFYVKGILYGDS
jgi:UDP-glucose 4-epimerase